MRGRKNKNILIGILCCALVFMGVGYAALNQVLNIKSTANVTGNYNIIIDAMEVADAKGATSNGIEVNKNTTASYNAIFSKPGDYITYTVTVKNTGNIKGVLNQIKVEQKVIDGSDMQSILDENGATVDEVFITKMYEKGTNVEFSPGKELDVEDTYEFDITTKINNRIEFIPNGEMKITITLKYDQIGSGTNLDTENIPGGETIISEPDLDDAEVNDKGLLTSIDVEKYTNKEGYLVLPATTPGGSPIKSIDRLSFLNHNASQFCDESEETGEDICGYIIYDEEHFDEIKEIIEGNSGYYGSGYDGSGYDGSGYYSSNNLLNKTVPSELTNNKTDKPTIKKQSEYSSGSGVYDVHFYRSDEIELSDNAEYIAIYADLEEKYIYTPELSIKKLDLSQATNLTSIKSYTFYGAQLSEVILSDSVTIIGRAAFAENQISELVLPDNMISIGEDAFVDNQISTLAIHNGVIKIGNSAFENNLISEVTIPNSVTTIGDQAFQDNLISNLTVSNGVTTIGSQAFQNNQISELTLPTTVTLIADSAFRINLINKLTILSSEMMIRYDAFSNQNYDEISGRYLGINKVIIESGTYEMLRAFDQISELTIKSGAIRARAFDNSGIKKLTLGNGVTSVGEESFENNEISELTIPSSVTSIEKSAFSNNPLTLINIQRTRADFNASVTIDSNWYGYDLSPTITYLD